MKCKEIVMTRRKWSSQLKGATIRSSKKGETGHFINTKFIGAGGKISKIQK